MTKSCNFLYYFTKGVLLRGLIEGGGGGWYVFFGRKVSTTKGMDAGTSKGHGGRLV